MTHLEKASYHKHNKKLNFVKKTSIMLNPVKKLLKYQEL